MGHFVRHQMVIGGASPDDPNLTDYWATRPPTSHTIAGCQRLWDRRKRSLTDPSELFGVYALTTFLTGAAAALVADQVEYFPGLRSFGSPWANRIGPWLAAGLVTGIIGVALWRAVTHAVLTARRVPSGLRTGLWLGFGFVAGELLPYAAEGNNWLPNRPALLLLPVLLVVVITCWTAQCAELWINTWRGSTLRPGALLILVGM
jgi:hypothetical protein